MAGRAVVPDVLASRYATDELATLWSPEHRVVAERRFWLTVLEAQVGAGFTVPPGALDDYRAVVDDVDLDSIRAREAKTRHDVKARIEEFDALAGHELVHAGMTSRDLTENVEAALVLESLRLIRLRAVVVLAGLAERAAELAALPITARTHNVPAQVTTLGKRFASLVEEHLLALERLDSLIERFPLRGIKGPVGTQVDLVDLVGEAGAAALERAVAGALGFERVLDSVGQIAPRSLDHDVVATLVGLAAAPANLALLMRLLAGYGLGTEGFAASQVGSSAMPHKMNARSSERISGLLVILRGHEAMAAQLAGAQWFEGDVSDSVVRRVVLPQAFFASDGIMVTAMTVLAELGFSEPAIDAELRRELPFLATTKILTAAVRAGSGRETAHEVIREHAVAAARVRSAGGDGGADLLRRLAGDPRLPLDATQLAEELADPGYFVGRAADQVASVLLRAAKVVDGTPGVATFRPPEIL